MPTQIEKLVQQLRSIAQQRLWMEPLLGDKREHERHRRTPLYAVDIDVVVLFGAPSRESARRPGADREGYAEIFPGDAAEAVIGLGRALADYIFWELQPGLPLFILPPMELELSDVAKAVASQALREQSTGRNILYELKVIHDKITSGMDSETQVATFTEQAARLVSLLYGEDNARSELHRLDQLISKQRIMTPEALVESGRRLDADLIAALSPPSTTEKKNLFTKKTDDWIDRLDAVVPNRGGRRKRRQKVETDAKALARLELINERLEPRRRLMLITGAKYMFAAGAGKPHGSGVASFSDVYLRHPKAFLGERGVLAPPEIIDKPHSQYSGDSIVDWLDTVWAKEDRQALDYMERLRRVLNESPQDSLARATRLLELHSDLPDTTEQKWSAFTKGLVARYATSIATVDSLIGGRPSSLRIQVEALSQVLNRLTGDLNTSLTAAWEQTFRVAVDSGLGLVAHGPNRPRRPRTTPAWTLETFDSVATPFMELVLAGRDEIDRKEFIKWHSKMQSTDPSGYIFFLSHGYLFALYGHWQLAAIVASLSESVARRYRKNNISGREAAYLYAVARRHCAKSESGLGEARAALERARAYLKEDRTPPDRSNHPGGEVRFNAEDVSLNLTRLLFGLFPQESGDASSLSDEVAVKTLRSIGVEIERQLNELPAAEKEGLVRKRTERQLLTYMFLVAFLRRNRFGDEINDVTLAPYRTQLHMNLEQLKYPIDVSFFVSIVSLLADWLLERRPVERGAFAKKIRDQLSDKEVVAASVMPYDRRVYLLIRETVSFT